MSTSPNSASLAEDTNNNEASGEESRDLTLGEKRGNPSQDGSGENTPPEKDIDMTDSERSDTGERSDKEQKQHYIPEDLDKDIDSVLEHNIQDNHVDPDGSGNIQNITVDSTKTSTLNIEVQKAAEKVDDSHESVDNPESHENGSEKSNQSDTDNNVVAESVVTTVLNKAIDIVRSEKAVPPEPKTEVTEAPKVDIKVGLFQYNEFENDDDSDIDEESDETNKEKGIEVEQQKDKKVGLFQYIDTEDRGESSEDNEDAIEDQVESISEEEKTNILKLYGLEGVGPISPKSASPSESGPSSLEDKAVQKVVDVQREVYEPSTRHFSITRDTSSNESTPRVDENGGKPDAVKNGAMNDNNAKDTIDRLDTDGTNNQSKSNIESNGQKESDSETENKVSQVENVTSVVNQPSSISPPLVQYESVTENGKFRIIKTTKEGGGIRVGGDVGSPKISPRSVESQDELARKTMADVNAVENVDPESESHTHVTVDKQSELKLDDLEQNGNNVKPEVTGVSQPAANDNTTVSTRNVGEDTRANHLDTDRIRKLLEEENVPLKLSLSKDTSVSRDSGVPRYQYSERSNRLEKPLTQDKNIQPNQRYQAPVSGTSPGRPTELGNESRDRYNSRDRGEREGPQTYSRDDVLTSDSRYIQLQHDDQPLNDRDRYLSGEHSRSEVTRDSSVNSSTYEEELLRRAYERVASQGPEKPQVSQSVRSHETKAIPGFKTLQDQQAKWSDMFHTIEDEHRRELRSQYDRHQYNIQRLQQQMELELQKQHLAIRKKLDIHKEALAKMSPDRDSVTRYRDTDRSLSPDGGQRSTTDRSRPIGEQNELAKVHGAFDTKTWREIYREVREEEEELSPRPLKRSLDDDFAHSSLDRSRPSVQRSSPRGSSDLSRSGSRERSRPAVLDSQRTPTNTRYSKAETDRSLGREGSRSYDRDISPGGRESRLYGRDSRSFRRETVSPVGDGSSQENVSRHVRELLDNLNDSRHSLHDLEDDVTLERPSNHHGDNSSDRPRAGVYSSPMPLFNKGRFSKSVDRPSDTSTLNETSRFTQSLPVGGDRAELYRERPRTTGGRDRISTESYRLEDSSLSPSTRMNLREKHSKHLADLRAYYEDELRELRQALSDTMDASGTSVDTSVQSLAQSQQLGVENRQLADKCRTLEDEMEEMQIQIRTLEQKNQGLEKRASEYAAAFTDSQTMCIQHRAHIEELQRYCRERDDLINDLESKKVSNDDSVKIYKKNLEDEMELHRQDKMSLQRMVDRYESLEREFKLLQETMNTTENKLYETRTEIVELNRTISKLELENKRLGRENDNLRHKVTQSLNLSQLHESFGSPASPRDVQNKPHTSTIQHDVSLSNQTSAKDQRLPGFATSMKDWSPAQKSRPKSAEVTRPLTEDSSHHSVVQKGKKESKSRRRETGETSKGRQSDRSSGARVGKGDNSISSSREDVSRSQGRKKVADDRPVRERTPPRTDRAQPKREVTPPRSVSPCSQAESEVSDYSPLLKAERELFKLRDMMRQAVAVKPCVSPPPLKLQKKFYGSERPSNRDDYTPDLGTARGRKETPGISSHAGVEKTKSSQTPARSDKSNSKRSKSERGDKGDKSVKSKDRGSGREEERRERGKEKTETRRQREKTPPSRDANSSTRFDIDINEENRSVSVTPRKVENQSGKHKNLMNGDDQSTENKPTKLASKQTNTGGSSQVENTLELMRNGQFTTRPEWENIYTSLAKPNTDTQQQQRNMEEKVKDRLKSIAEMETRYDGLQVQKRQLESSINKIPLHGRVDRNNRKHKEELENELDAVERELGSLKMTLKRYNVLKTAG